MLDLIKMLEKSKPVRVPGTAVFLTNDPTSAPSSFMHNLKHNKVVHERVVMMCVRTERRAARAAGATLRDRASRPISSRSRCTTAIWSSRAFPPRSRSCARRAQVRHHDDVVLRRPAHPEAGAEFGHAEMAGHLFIALPSRRRARRTSSTSRPIAWSNSARR